MEILLILLSVLATIGIAGGVFFYRHSKKLEEKLKDPKYVEMSEEQAIEKASSKAQGIIREAEEKATAIKVKAEKSAQDAHKNLVDQEERLDKREKSLLERSKSIDSRYDALEKQEAELESAKLEIKNLKDELETKLEKIANLSREEAKEQLMKEVEETLAEMIAKRIRDSEFKLQSEVEEQSKNLLIDAMQRSATDYVAETTSTTIEIEKDELKGKIIGKDGRNIRAFERMTGVDIIIDEAPNQVTVSSFDPIRREVAAIAISKLLTDGRVHPGTIEETILNIKADVAKEIKKTGEKIAYDTGFNDLPPEIIKLLGRFKYRFSY
ncbi:DUF3552 domain-containing protein, partial [Candidatus Dojkabacteria bacterium]|nr:DUF3552 domain-containing protein [Candidatus Dojkabacteria bacterium]